MSTYEILFSELRPQKGVFYTNLLVRSVFLFCLFFFALGPDYMRPERTLTGTTQTGTMKFT